MVTLLKLTNGFEVAGIVEHEDKEMVVLSKPLQINYRYFVGPSPSVSFIRYIMFSEMQSAVFQKSHIITQVKARSSFEKVYEYHAEYYYNEHEKIIDTELGLHKKANDDENMKNYLESISIDGASIN